MGWAKYFEDNLEIMIDRQFMKQSSAPEYAVTVVCTTIVHAMPQTNAAAVPTSRPAVKYEDKYIVCKDCGKKFLFSAQAQNQFARKGWSAPKRCKCCRDQRNARYLMCASF